MALALMFPGQGSQSVGMGRTLYDAYPASRAVFEEVDSALGESLSTLIFEGPEDRLTLTENAQPVPDGGFARRDAGAGSVPGFDVKSADFVAGHSPRRVLGARGRRRTDDFRYGQAPADSRPGHAGRGRAG